MRRHLRAVAEAMLQVGCYRQRGRVDDLSDIRQGLLARQLTVPAPQHPGGRGTRGRECLHPLRVTWITLTLAVGAPLQLVQHVTGHRTVEGVMKHYFRPGR